VAKPEVTVSVNYMPIQIDDFIQRFIEAVVSGMLSTLKETGDDGDDRLSIDGDNVEITMGNDTIPLNPFVSQFIRNTVIGILSALKGVGQVDRAEINIRKVS
jgi:hypothetical protein